MVLFYIVRDHNVDAVFGRRMEVGATPKSRALATEKQFGEHRSLSSYGVVVIGHDHSEVFESSVVRDIV